MSKTNATTAAADKAPAAQTAAVEAPAAAEAGAVGPGAVAGRAAAAWSGDPFAGVSFTSEWLRLMQQLIGAYVRHDDDCPGDGACSCGLTANIQELVQRERNLRRYGTGLGS